MAKSVILKVSGRTIGGSTYAMRIMKALSEHPSVTVRVTTGDKQDTVARAVRKTVQTLEEFAGRKIKVRVVKLKP